MGLRQHGQTWLGGMRVLMFCEAQPGDWSKTVVRIDQIETYAYPFAQIVICWTIYESFPAEFHARKKFRNRQRPMVGYGFLFLVN